MKGVLEFVGEIYAKWTTACCLAVAAIVLAVDYATGKAVQFPILYILPVGLAAWSNKRGTAYAITILLPLARVLFHFPWLKMETMPVSVLNSLIRIIVLAIFAYLLDKMASQTRELRKKVKVLEGILPICASCKRIRNEKGEYEQMEKYVIEHSEASFSHGICNECAKKLYPEYFHGDKRQ
ncbi:MAG: hypothetical protein KKC76_04150 [Proteobacteria bacterium]|nr:hypothetical protein [Pseudomonadota bacterium]MBU4298048.1 hypothetical protein [Pseudomonadota bacterium]MCG2746335.1 hypothetical protein [Desulfobulbaceae bacterium]